jgi:peptidoglycan/xylan/chitin deacetylase (PgdA/CDA1 family)
MWRRLAKTGIACGLSWTGADDWIGSLSGSRHRPLVVGYHRVVEDGASTDLALPGMVISRGMLERHLDWIGRRYRFVSLDELGERLLSADAGGEAVAAVTFDDGYSDVYHNALPVLRRKGIPAAVFVVSDLVGTNCLPLYDRLFLLLSHAFGQNGTRPRVSLPSLLLRLGLPFNDPASRRALARGPFQALGVLLDRLPQLEIQAVIAALAAETGTMPRSPELRPLTWEMLLELQGAGVTIGSHTRSHALLTNERAERMHEEAAGSRQALEQRLPDPVVHFAYPDGRWDAAAVGAVAAAGYRFAYTVCSHQDAAAPLLTIPRRMLWEESCLDSLGRFSESVMSCQMNGVFDMVAPCVREHGTALRAQRLARSGA